MRIRNFGFDWPYRWDETYIQKLMIERNFSHDEATSYDYAQNWQTKSSDFLFNTRCIAALYQRLFLKNFEAGVWKIQVDCVENEPNTNLKTVGGVISTEVTFDFDKFNRVGNKEKKAMALEALYAGINIIVEKKGWDKQLFDEVYREIIKRDYINEWVWAKKRSPDRSKTAEVLCLHDVEKFDAFIEVRDKTGTLMKKQLLFSTKPDELIFYYNLGELKWLSNNEIALYDKWTSTPDKILVTLP